MTRAAFYARYSSDRQDEVSIKDQILKCEQLAKSKGWTKGEIYSDAAISGATTLRPGYQKMLEDARDGSFDVVVAEALDRLSRDQENVAGLFKQLTFLEIPLVTVAEGEINELHVGLKGTMNALYLKDLAQKTHRGLEGRHRAGYSAGGNCFGYRLVPDDGSNMTSGRRQHPPMKREIDHDQALWVEQIFEWYADGWSPRRIAVELNRLGVPSPRGGTWSGTAVSGTPGGDTGFINNRLYVGVSVWNRSRWVRDPDTGKKTRRPRPKEEWIETPLLHLRIVSDELWARVKERQREVHEKSENIRAALKQRSARSGAGPKYLFSGLLKCGECGGNYAIADRHRYGCSKNVNRGPTACENSIKVARAIIEERLLDSIKRDLFTPEAIELFKRETARLLAERRARRQPDQVAQRQRLAKVEKEIENIMAAIKAGIITPTTKAEMEKAEAEKAELDRAIEGNATILELIPVALPDAVERFRALVDDFENVAMRDVSRARTQIKKLVGGQVTLHPTDDGHLEAEMRGDYAGLIRLIEESPGSRRTEACKLSVVAGARHSRLPTYPG